MWSGVPLHIFYPESLGVAERNGYWTASTQSYEILIIMTEYNLLACYLRARGFRLLTTQQNVFSFR